MSINSANPLLFGYSRGSLDGVGPVAATEAREEEWAKYCLQTY